jgi:hypothetical protein
MSQENVEIVRRWWEGFNEDGFPPPELCDPQLEVRIPSKFPFTGIYHGHEGVRKWASEVFDVIEEHRVDIEDVVQAPHDETVVIALRSKGRSKQMQIEMNVGYPRRQTRIRAGLSDDGRGPRSRRAAGVGDVHRRTRLGVASAGRTYPNTRLDDGRGG